MLLRLVTIPLLALKSGKLASEANARYCARCRRNMNAALFFITFIVAFVVVLKWRGH